LSRLARAVLALAASCACTPVTTSRAPLEDVPPASLDSLSAHPALDSEYHQSLLAARWHLLRALDERSRNHFEEAQRDLDLAFKILASLDDSPYLEADEPRPADAATESSGEGALLHATAEVDHLAAAVEEAYFSILPNLDRFSADSPLSLLLEGLSAEELEDLPPDAGQIARIHQLAPQCSIPVDANPRVAASVHFFQTRGRATYQAWTKRSGRYRGLILRILRAERVPEDFLYLAMIESGFNPHAYSRAHAAGLWQFILPTARLEGLRRDHWVDERRDPVRSTRAAARHLKSLYAELGDWRLVAASYNAGRGRVQRAIERAGVSDFWKLNLPQETQQYVPLLMAAAVMSKQPQLFGFDALEVDPALRFEEVQLSRYVDLKVAARIMGISLASLRQLNPELRRLITPPRAKGRYTLHVPPGKGAAFLTQYARLPASEKPGVYEYVVQPGDNISTIARDFGVRIGLIADANSLGNPNLIHPGLKLYIPVDGKLRRTRSLSASAPNQGDALYTVKLGDSLSRIAQSFGVTVAQIRQLNNRSGDLIRPGEKLRVRPTSRPPGELRSPSPSRLAGRQMHTVGRGDNLWSLARRFSISVADLRQWNKLRDSTIFPGQELIVRASDFRVYTVVQGDTLYSIARRFGLDPRQIARHNNISLSTTLLTGMQLEIKTLEQVE